MFPHELLGTLWWWMNKEFYLLQTYKFSKQFTVRYFTPGYNFKGEEGPVNSDDQNIAGEEDKSFNLWVRDFTLAKGPYK